MNIIIEDDLHPEDTAMLQALYSRSASSVSEHLTKVHESGSGKFMEQFYIGYGHDSIGDCGSTTIFIEGVSELCAKALQDHPLYSGQQTSSRYIDFSTQPVLDPLRTPETRAIVDHWMDFYTASMPVLTSHLKNRLPREPGTSERTYETAISARSFDILRGFLPAGVTTQLSWHTNLRQARDHLRRLATHPLAEVREVAQNVHGELKKQYPHSFRDLTAPGSETYTNETSRLWYLRAASSPFSLTTSIDPVELSAYQQLLESRPAKASLPAVLEELGHVQVTFPLDYGSFRDLQRHRRGVIRMPLLMSNPGFHPWYLEQLPPALKDQAEQLINEQTSAISQLDTTDELRQYYLAMGIQVNCRVTWGLPEVVYVTELRSGSTVHPTLRTVAHQIHRELVRSFPGLRLHTDLTEDRFSVKRGDQDIVKK